MNISLKLPSEYWYTHDDELIECDSDAGADSPSHMSVVSWYLAQELIEKLRNKKLDRYAEIFQAGTEEKVCDFPYIRTVLNDTADADTLLTQAQRDNITDYLRKVTKKSARVIRIITNSPQADEFCPRDYAIRKLDWIRFTRDTVEIHKPNKKTLDRVRKAVVEMFDEYGYFEDDDNTENLLLRVSPAIASRSPDKFVFGVSLGEVRVKNFFGNRDFHVCL